MEFTGILKIGPLNILPLGLCPLKTVIIAIHCQLILDGKL
jgi:hypothetical protein